MRPDTLASPRKGRIALSIQQDVLDRLEPFKAEVNLSAQAEQLFIRLAEQLENRDWVKRNAASLDAHGGEIAATGLAGAEFERI